jgi:hypothetical protein
VCLRKPGMLDYLAFNPARLALSSNLFFCVKSEQ